MKGKNIRVGRWYVIDRSVNNNGRTVNGKILSVLIDGYWNVKTDHGSRIVVRSDDFISQIRNFNDVAKIEAECLATELRGLKNICCTDVVVTSDDHVYAVISGVTILVLPSSNPEFKYIASKYGMRWPITGNDLLDVCMQVVHEWR